MPDIIINDAAIFDLIRHPESRLARFLEGQANRVVAKAQDNLSDPYPPAGVIGGHPALRTGVLRSSVHRFPAFLGPNGIFVDVIADAERDGHEYGITLRDRGYVFIDDQDLQTLGE